jgi:CPA2 family monovalent cation:H+ antiporter-2
MDHGTPLITTIVAGLGLAFLFGFLAYRLKLPMIAGYLAAGVLIGPFTPGYVADQDLANQLAEIGVILLMFGVGLHFSLRDLMSVKAIAIPGAIGQIVVASVAGAGLALGLGWGLGAGVIFGLSLSVASTVVLLRALQDGNVIREERGRIAVGWLIVEDLVMVVALVLIPPLAGLLGGVADVAEGTETVQAAVELGMAPIAATLLVTALKVAAFVALMLIVGRRVIPWLLHLVAHTGQRELFRLSVLAIALTVAWGSATFFGVSFALGAFFAGMVMAGSTLSNQAMKETLPLRDAFAVLFFVSVGMLFNPSTLWTEPFSVMVTVLVIVVVKAVAAYAITRAFGRDRETALTIGASLAQIGEFSFILIVMGESLEIVPPVARDLVVAGALISILLNPLILRHLARLIPAPAPAIKEPPDAAPPADPDPARDPDRPVRDRAGPPL